MHGFDCTISMFSFCIICFRRWCLCNINTTGNGKVGLELPGFVDYVADTRISSLTVTSQPIVILILAYMPRIAWFESLRNRHSVLHDCFDNNDYISTYRETGNAVRHN